MKLTFVGGSGCASGPCPAVYKTENQTFVIQGFTVDPSQAGITLPPGELLVEIPCYILENALAQASQGTRSRERTRAIGLPAVAMSSPYRHTG